MSRKDHTGDGAVRQRLLDTAMALLCAAILALLICSIARTEGVSPIAIRADALSAAGAIFVALACGSLLKRRK
jgi:hypothetical protein